MAGLDKIRQAFPEFKDASDAELIGQISKMTGGSVGQISDMLGVAPRGILAETGRQIAGGAVSDLPSMAGQALKYFSDEGSPTYQYGQEMQQNAEKRGIGYEPDIRGRGMAGKAAIYGGRGLAPAAAVIGTSLIPGVGEVVAPVAAATLYGGSSAQDTYEKILEQTGDKQAATDAARRVGMIQGVGEAAATFVGGRAVKGLGSAFGIGEKSTEAVAKGLTNTAVARPFARDMATNLVVQPLTEVAQDLGTYGVEQAYGAKKEDPFAIAEQSALGGIGLTAFLGPLSLGGHMRRAKGAQTLKDLLDPNSTAPLADRAQAMDLVMSEAKRQGVKPENTEQWFNDQMMLEDKRIEAQRQVDQELKGVGTDLTAVPNDYVKRINEKLLSAFNPEEELARRAAEGRPMSEAEASKYLSSFQAVQKAGQEYQDLMASQEERLGRVQEVGQQWQGLVGKKGDQALRAQEVGDMARPITSRLESEAEQQEAPIISMLRAGAGAQALPGLTKGAGTKADFKRIMNPQVMQPVDTADVQPPVQRTQLVPQQAAPFSNIRMDRPTQEVGQAAVPLSERPAPVSPPPGAPSAVQPTTPAVVGASLKAPKRGPKTPQAKQAKAQGQELSSAESAHLSKLLSDIDSTDVGDVLPANVKSDKNAVPGRASIEQTGLKRIRDALVLGKETADEKTQQIVNALQNFASAYKVYSDQGGQALSRRNKIAERKTATEFAAEETGAVAMHAANVQAALAELGTAVNGNAKDIEAVVRLVKDMVQGKLVSPGSMRKDTRKALRKLDTNLSQAWAAAKRESFMGKEPDTADIRTGAIRGSVEVKGKGKMPTLVKIAKEGISAGKDNGRLFGLPAILHYMRTNGTPMERALSLALRETIVGQESNLKLEFTTDGNQRFDPKTNTVYLNQEESPEVILHEAFHAALQSFVYKNPNHPAVVQLKKSLKSVIGYKGELTGKALEVQNLLKGLVKEGNELDAVLELVSYGNTLAEFRKALQTMKSDKNIPPTFLDSINKAWAAIKQIASRLLGGRASLASDVLQSSMELLEKARLQTPVTGQGQVLQASVKSDETKQPALADTIEAQVAKTTPKVVKEAGYPDMRTYADSQSSWRSPTRVFFEYLGFGATGSSTQKIRDAGMRTAAVIRKDFPTLERVILNINSKFSNPPALNSLIEFFKTHQNTGILQMERVVQYLQFHPQDAKAVLDYLDGDVKAADTLKNKEYIVAIADNVKQHLQTYIDSLPVGSKERQLFDSLKFTEYLLNPESIAQLATKSFGLQKLTKLLGIERREETSIDGFKAFLPMKEGVFDSEAPLYQTFETYINNDGESVRVPRGFIGKDIAENNPPAGMDIERSRVWKLERYTGKTYNFVSRITTKNEIKEMAEKQKIDELSAALMNTMAALSHNYAGRNFFHGIVGMGREDGKATASTVVFNDVSEINDTFKGRIISDANVLKVSDEAAKMTDIRWQTQRTGTWVRLPASETYGELSGKIVAGPVWNAMVDMHDRSPLIKSQLFNTTMTWFKKSKTVFSPATHMNNILSNYSLMLLHGISHKSLRDAASLFSRFELSPKSLSEQETAMVKAFLSSGAVLGQFTQTEAKQTIAKALIANLSPDSNKSFLTTLADLAKVEKEFAKAMKIAKNVDTVATELYAAGDNIFRLAAFMNTAGNIQVRDGTKSLDQKQLEEAGIAARKQFLDYDIDARWVRAARQSALPFISWSYAIMPVLGRLAIEKPWAMVNMMAALALASSAMGGDDDDETRKSMPEQVREKFLGVPMYFRVPFMGDADNPVYYNVGKSIPMMSLLQPSPQKSKVLGQDWVPGFLNPSGPYVSLLATAVFGIDPFTGKSVTLPTDENFDRFKHTATAVYDTMAPSFLTSRFGGQLKDWAEGKTGPTGKEPNALFLARTLGGLSLYEFNVQESQFFQDLQIKKMKSEFASVMNKAKRDEYAKGYPDYEALDEELNDLTERLEKRIAKIRGEE